MDMLESEEDFASAYDSYNQRILRFMFWRTKDSQLSEDLTSTVFEKAWRNRTRFSGGSVQAWLFRIARNTLTDHWRKKKDVSLEDADMVPDQADTLAATLDTKLEVERMEQALQKIPATMRSVVELRFIHGLSAAETAQRLNIKEGNVRTIQYRALQRIKKELL
jgi:RNA polymerase sigma-70 factor (ECF subfamily)